MNKSVRECLLICLTATLISMVAVPPLIAATRPATTTVKIVNTSGEQEFTIVIPKGKKTLRGYIVTDSGKKRVNVTIEVDQDSGSVLWKE
jgi:hypothetical protein